MFRWLVVVVHLLVGSLLGLGSISSCSSASVLVTGQDCSEQEPCPQGQVCVEGECQPVPSCIDADDDGYGKGCPKGSDCNDAEKTIHPNAMEVCGDGVDNNCDDQIDEDCVCRAGETRLCSSVADPYTLSPVMHCRAGIQMCEDGKWAAICIGEVGPQDEVCDGIDNDCDGEVDEGLLNPVGLCSQEVPSESCGKTGEGNGLDDDGDGKVDEDCSCAVPDYDPMLPRQDQPCYSGPIHTLGIGTCHGGKRNCNANGTWEACREEQLPLPEVCDDGLDNDCDGLIDEGCSWCKDPNPEVCDGRDNDCDGLIDEGLINACGTCDAVADAEVCNDGLDNDCDGRIDNESECGGCSGGQSEPCYPGPPTTANVGACRMGERTCDGEFFDKCVGYVLPTLENCGEDATGNGIDDDCDGEVDEDCNCPEGHLKPCGTAAGQCEYGFRECKNNQYGPCVGAVESVQEICDGLDNDCDGLVDEDLLNACGKCGESCYELDTQPADQGEVDEGLVQVVADDPHNPTDKPGITLTQRSFIPPYLWAANHSNDTVTKFNTELEVEEGIYWVGDNPSRTAVDLDGNMWVGGRSDGRLTKVLFDTQSCPDRNNNGVVDTSQAPGGVAQLVNSAQDPFADECVVYSAVPGTPSIRGVAAAPDGKVWIGYTAGGIQSIDPVTFELGPFYPSNAVPLFRPDANGIQQPTGEVVNAGGVYGMVIDSLGNLYYSQNSGRTELIHFDTNTEKWVAAYAGMCGCYGIAVDGKNRVWLGSYPHCGGINMFDPAEKRHYTFAVPAGFTPQPGATSGVHLLSGDPLGQVQSGEHNGGSSFRTTGVAVEPNTGDVWTSFYPLGYTGRLRLNENDYSQSQYTYIGTTKKDDGSNLDGVGNDLRGVGFDNKGYAWTLGLCSDHVFKIDPATNRRAASLPEGKSIGVGKHYTYSDFTGSTSLSFTSPRGYWTYVFESQFDQAEVDGIIWQAYVPPGTTAGVRIRAVDSNSWLPQSVAGTAKYFFYPEGQAQHEIDLRNHGGPVMGQTFEVEVRLTTADRDILPVVHDVRLVWQRP